MGRTHGGAEWVRYWQGARSQPRLGRSGRAACVVSFHLAGGRIRGRPARLGGVTVEAARAQTVADQAVRLGAQELRPARAYPPRCRPEARAAQHGRDRGGRDADAELEQLTLDTHVAPAWILSRQPLNQTAHLGRKRGTTGPATVPAPIPVPQRPVPAPQRLRIERKAGPPPLGWKQPAGRGEQGSVDRRVLRPLLSTLEDRELVAQDDDLKLALTATASEHANENAQEPVQQTREHDAQSEPAWPRSPTRPSWPNRISLPHRIRD